MFHNRITKLLGVVVFTLAMQSCVASTDRPIVPGTITPDVETVASPTAVALTEPTPTLFSTPELLTPEIVVDSTPIVSTTRTPMPDIHNLGLLVFKQTEEQIGRLSFDGTQFHPLSQVPKLDRDGLEQGLFANHSGYHISPNGRWLSTIIGYDQLVLIDIISNQRHPVAHIGNGAWLNWSLDSQAFAYREGDSKVCWVRLIEQTTINCFDEFDGKVVAAAWSPNGNSLALSIATQSELPTQGVVDGAVWVIDMTTEQAQFITNQNLPLSGISTDFLLIWTAVGLIINRLPEDGSPAILIDAGYETETLLTANVVSASPSGEYIIYEDGRVEQIGDGAILAELPTCTEIEGQTMHVVWAYNENRVAYTVHCSFDDEIQLGINDLDDNDLSWSLALSNEGLKLIGWSYDNHYLFFQVEPENPQLEGYKIKRLETNPDNAFELVADSTFLIGILSAQP